MRMGCIVGLVFCLVANDGAGMERPSKPTGEVVVFLHGIGRSSDHMGDIETYLERYGYDVVNLDYPSTRYPLESLVELIHRDISEARIEDKPVHFVGFSLGGILARAVIHKYPPRFLGRVVQLAPPNHGSEMADFFEGNWLFSKLYGPAGQALTTGNARTRKLLGNVSYELGVVAGNRTIDPFSSIIIPGDDDGKVSIRSTKLEAMTDHIVVDASHTFFPGNARVHEQTVSFLRYGAFRHPEQEKGRE